MSNQQDRVVIHDSTSSADEELEPLAPSDPGNPNKPAAFDYITENVYISPSLQYSKDRKRAKRMVCDCQFDPEADDPADACGENCLNRLLMMECGSRCPCGEYCNNKNFQRARYASVEVFKTDKKGWGLKAVKPILGGSFVMEYCGEVCTIADFERRKVDYSKEKRRHYYFMSLKTDEILDATRKGNMSRFINHSCDPNCETQKWTVNGRLCIGFFSVRKIEVDEELTFDYQFQRFGDVAQKCYCGSANCRGYLGQTKQTPSNVKVLSQHAEQGGSPHSPSTRRRGKHRIQSHADSVFEKDLHDLVGSSWRLKSSEQVIAFSRRMLQAESPSQRIMLLQVLLATEDSACLRKFLSLHGLRLLWSWMIDSADLSTSQAVQFRIHVLRTLSHLPVISKNQLDESKLLPVVTKWADPPRIKEKSPGPVAMPTPSPSQGAEEEGVEGAKEKSEVIVEGAEESSERTVAERSEGTVEGAEVWSEQGAEIQNDETVEGADERIEGKVEGVEEMTVEEKNEETVEGTGDEVKEMSVGTVEGAEEKCVQGASIQGASIQGASIQGASIQGASIQGADVCSTETVAVDIGGGTVQGAENHEEGENEWSEEAEKEVAENQEEGAENQVEGAKEWSEGAENQVEGAKEWSEAAENHDEGAKEWIEGAEEAMAVEQTRKEPEETVITEADSAPCNCEEMEVERTVEGVAKEELSVAMETKVTEVSCDSIKDQQREDGPRAVVEEQAAAPCDSGGLFKSLGKEMPCDSGGIINETPSCDSGGIVDDKEGMVSCDYNEGHDTVYKSGVSKEESEVACDSGGVLKGEENAPCDSGGVVTLETMSCDSGGVVKEQENVSCEAEGIELEAAEVETKGVPSPRSPTPQNPEAEIASPQASPTPPQVVEPHLQAQVESLAQELLEKWSKLKEVFRIPKRAPSAKPAVTPPPPENGGEQEEEPVAMGRRRGRGRGRREADNTSYHHHHHHHQHRDRSRRTNLSSFQSGGMSNHSSSSPHGTPSSGHHGTPSGHHAHSSNHYQSGGSPNHYQPSSSSSNQGYQTSNGPVQNTVLLQQQQQGQGLYIQQQGQAPPTSYVQVQQTRLSSIQPLLPTASSHASSSMYQPSGSILQAVASHTPQSGVTTPTLNMLSFPNSSRSLMLPNSGITPLPATNLTPPQPTGVPPRPNSSLMTVQHAGLTPLTPRAGLTLTTTSSSLVPMPTAAALTSVANPRLFNVGLTSVPNAATLLGSQPATLQQSQQLVQSGLTPLQQPGVTPQSGLTPIHQSGLTPLQQTGVTLQSGLTPLQQTGITPQSGLTPLQQSGVTPAFQQSGLTPALQQSGLSSSVHQGLMSTIQPQGLPATLQQSAILQQSTALQQSGLIQPSPQHAGLTLTPQQGLTPTPQQGLTPTPQQGLTPTPQQGLTPTLQQGLTPTPRPGSVPPGLSPAAQSGLTPTYQSGLSTTPQRGLSPMPQSNLTPVRQSRFSPSPYSALTPTPQSRLTPTPQSGLTATSQPGLTPTPQAGLTPTPQTGLTPTPQTGLLPMPQTGAGLIPAGVTPLANPALAPGLLPTPHSSTLLSNLSRSSLRPAPTTPIAPLIPTTTTITTPLVRPTQTANPSPIALVPLPPPPPDEASMNLPPHWKVARDATGKVYYYHSITRKTQWDKPTSQDEGVITMDLATPTPESTPEPTPERGGVEVEQQEQEEVPQSVGPRTPVEEAEVQEETSDTQPEPVEQRTYTPEGTPPPSSPSSPSSSPMYTQAASTGDHTPSPSTLADTGPAEPHTPPSDQQPTPGTPPLQDSPSPQPHTPPFTPPPMSPLSISSETEEQGRGGALPPPPKRRRKNSRARNRHQQQQVEEFKHKLSRMVTSCLDQHRKSDCKYGRITCAEDFKYLARKLTYGLTEKEMGRKRHGNVEFTNSVKTKVKEYIRQYMKKCGPVYKRVGTP